MLFRHKVCYRKISNIESNQCIFLDVTSATFLIVLCFTFFDYFTQISTFFPLRCNFAVILAPTATIDPTVPVEEKAEPATKEVEIQTMYRDSEAQTMPYTPDYIVPAGTAPEVLLLKDLHYENGGLSVGQKELGMIEFARMKRDVEANLPPFTDEASMNLRKRLMEAQEMREFQLRENEIDAKREAKIFVLRQALEEKNESAEFLSSQRVESIRQARMEERETNLQKIRNKRIKVLRKLANRRNQQEPQLSSTEPKDIIDSYFDKASEVYVPLRRKGGLNKIESEKFEVKSRTASMDVLANVRQLEDKIPNKIKSSTIELGAPLNPLEGPKQLNETGYLLEKKGGRAAEPRMTSAAVRAERNKKRDIEKMAKIIAKQKVNDRGSTRGGTAATVKSVGGEGDDASALVSQATKLTGSAGMSSPGRRGTKARPASPDFTKSDHFSSRSENLPLTIACVILQKLIRGRAVQNMMYEGRYRRAELIAELRSADEMAKINFGKTDDTIYTKQDTNQEALEPVKEEAPVEPVKYVPTVDEKANRELMLRENVLDAAAGSASSNLVYSLVQEQERNEIITHMHNMALEHVQERRMREAMESGRRQREYMRPPVQPAPDQDGETEELRPVSIIRDPLRPITPPDETEGTAQEVLFEIVDNIMREAIENVSRPTTGIESKEQNSVIIEEPDAMNIGDEPTESTSNEAADS